MNTKTFALAVLFLLATLAWLGTNIYWDVTRHMDWFDTILAVVFVLFAMSMVNNERHKKKRRHVADVNKNQIP